MLIPRPGARSILAEGLRTHLRSLLHPNHGVYSLKEDEINDHINYYCR